MTIPQLVHQDSTERATNLFGFNAWLDAQKPSHEEQEKILNTMHEEDLARQADENGNRFRSIGDQLAH